MDEYGGKRVCDFGLARRGTALAFIDSQDASRSSQCSNRLVYSSRFESDKGIHISNSGRGRYLKPSFRSSCSKTIFGSSSRSASDGNSLKTSHRNRGKGILLGESTSPKDEAETGISGCCPIQAGIETANPELGEAEPSVSSDIMVNTTVEVGSSQGPANMRLRKQNPQSTGSNQYEIPGGSIFRPTSSARITHQMAKTSSHSQPINSHKHGLRNFSCSSMSAVLTSSTSLPDSRRSKKVNVSKKRSPPDEGSSSGRGKSISGPSTRGNSNIQRTASGGSSLSYPERSLPHQAITRTRNQSLEGNVATTSITTRRTVGHNCRTQDTKHSADGIQSQLESRFMTNFLETESATNEMAATDSSQLFSSESPPRSPINYARARNGTFQNHPSTRPEYNRAWTPLEGGRFLGFNLDEISEVLLALERLELDEELTHEQVLVLETNLLLRGFGFHDQHRDMRLDIDNMSYEELLALEERMGTVSTALSEEELSNCLKRYIFEAASPAAGSIIAVIEDIKCSICQEEYIEGDEVGTLRCEHLYHVACISQWLRLKNWCPICKGPASSP